MSLPSVGILSAGAPLLEVESLRVQYGAFAALCDVSFELRSGETLGLVGESGSGKSTLARAVLRLTPAASGRVLWQGEDLLSLGAADLRRRRRDLQIVFQDPLASLNPRMSIGDALAEPLKIFEPSSSAATRHTRIVDMLQRVGLSADMLRRYPHEFSGGQCQRIGIARAMMLRPKLLVCDEAVSSLDVSVQGQIVNLLTDLQRDFDFEDGKFCVGIKFLPMIKDAAFLLPEGKISEIYSPNCDQNFIIGEMFKEGIPVALPWQTLFNTHIGIFGNTGSGKSNTLVKLYTTLFDQKIRALGNHSHFVILDFNGSTPQDN